jgi:hypothetical protein
MSRPLMVSPSSSLGDPPGHVLLALLPDLDIDKDEGVHPYSQVLFQSIIPALRCPRFGIEYERKCLTEIVHL